MRTRRTLAQIRQDIVELQAEFRRVSSLNLGVIRGWVKASAIGERIRVDRAEYNRRSKRDHYELGRLVRGPAE